MAGQGQIDTVLPRPRWRRRLRVSRPRSRRTRLLTALAASASLAVLPVSPAATAAESASDPSVAEVLTSLGVDRAAADYVVLVDTSRSMSDSGLYKRVRDAVRPFLAALAPADHLSLITFDGAPNLRYTGAVGTQPDRALAQLPGDALGTGTDIGAGLAAALSELERPDANDIAALVLITDGKIVAPGSPYADVDSAAWRSLAARAAARARSGSLSGYALGLRGDTDAGALQTVLPGTLVVSLPADQIAPYLRRVKEQTSLAKARELLRPDLASRVTASWSGDLGGVDLNRGTAAAELTLASAYRHLPVTVTGLRVTPTDLPGVAVDALPDRVDLAPGQRRTLPVTLRLTAPTGFRLGTREVVQHGQLALAGAVTSPWETALRDITGPAALRLANPPAPVTATGTVGWSWLRLLVTALLALLVLLVGRLWWRSRQPVLRGRLEVSRNGLPVLDDAVLRGRRAVLGKGTLRSLKGVATGRISAVRRTNPDDRRRETGLRLAVRSAGRRHRFVLWPEDRRSLGDGLEFAFHAD